MVDSTAKVFIGQRIEYFRTKANLTQDELAEKMGYKSGSSMISQVERGTAGMSVEQAINAAKILKIHPAALLSEKELSNEDILLLSDFLTLLASDKRPNIEAIKTLIKASI